MKKVWTDSQEQSRGRAGVQMIVLEQSGAA